MNSETAEIVTASIRYPRGNVLDAISGGECQAVVTATFDDGSQGEVLKFYADELTFAEREFTGLTRADVSALFHRRDVA